MCRLNELHGDTFWVPAHNTRPSQCVEIFCHEYLLNVACLSDAGFGECLLCFEPTEQHARSLHGHHVVDIM